MYVSGKKVGGWNVVVMLSSFDFERESITWSTVNSSNLGSGIYNRKSHSKLQKKRLMQGVLASFAAIYTGCGNPFRCFYGDY